MKDVSVKLGAIAVALGMLVIPGTAQDKDKDKNRADRAAGAMTGGSRGQDRIAREVRHELVMLPYYGVFDNLAFRVDGGTVTLLGQVTRPHTKKRRRKRGEGYRRRNAGREPDSGPAAVLNGR